MMKQLEMKEKFGKNVKASITDKKNEVDPKEVTEKLIKFNLNMITFDNFDEIKKKILEIASQK